MFFFPTLFLAAAMQIEEFVPGTVNVFAYRPSRRRARKDDYEWVEGSLALVVIMVPASAPGAAATDSTAASDPGAEHVASSVPKRSNGAQYAIKFSGTNYMIGDFVCLNHGSDPSKASG